MRRENQRWNTAGSGHPSRQYAFGALQRSFRTYTAQRLIAGTAYGASNTSYDDLLWWALAYLRAHELCVAQPAVLCDAPGGGSLLQQGRLIFDFMYDHSWNEDFCDGGYCWALKAQNYKNCVTNQQGVLVAAKLARLLPVGARCDCKAGESYRAIALRTSGWLRRSPMRNASNGLYNDGQKAACYRAARRRLQGPPRSWRRVCVPEALQ